MIDVSNQEPRHSVLDDLRELELPAGSYMVMGSGILDALGIRPADDVDMVVQGDVYDRLRSQGWSDHVTSGGVPNGIEQGVFQAYDRWSDETVIKTLEQLLPDAEWVNGVPFNSLARLSLYKVRRGLPKDLADLELIGAYQRSTTE